MLAGTSDRKTIGAPTRAAVFVAGHWTGRRLGPGKRWRANETVWATATHRVTEAGESETARRLGRQSGLRPGNRTGGAAKALERSRERCASLPAGVGARGLMETDHPGEPGVVSDTDDPNPPAERVGPSNRGSERKIW